MDNRIGSKMFLTCAFWCVLQFITMAFLIATIYGVSLGVLGIFGMVAGVPKWSADAVTIISIVLVSWRSTYIIDRKLLEI